MPHSQAHWAALRLVADDHGSRLQGFLSTLAALRPCCAKKAILAAAVICVILILLIGMFLIAALLPIAANLAGYV
jgi:hypothetical protein